MTYSLVLVRMQLFVAATDVDMMDLTTQMLRRIGNREEQGELRGCKILEWTPRTDLDGLSACLIFTLGLELQPM